MNKLGIWVKDKRLNCAESQVEYAEKIGITNVTLSKIENGEKIGINVLKKLSVFFNVRPKILKEMMEIEV